MKFHKITALIVTLLVLGVTGVQAQWDDVYYDPDKDVIVERTNRYSSNSDRDFRDSRSYDDEYGYYNDYDFYYTSRIRRFQRPMFGFGFFDPIYIDALYYDPFMQPGMTMLIYDDIYSRRAWARSSFWYSPFNRFNRFSTFGGFYDPFFSPFGFNSFYGSRFGFGFGASPFGFNSFNALYCPPSWGNNFNYNNATNFYSDINSRGTTYAPRRGGSSISPNPNAVTRRGTIGNSRGNTPVTVDGRRPYPYSSAGTNSLKPNSRTPNYRTSDSRERSRTRSATAQPYSGTRNSRINSNNSRTRTRSITPSSRTRTRTINSGSSRTRTRSISPSSRTRINNSGSNSSRSRISTPSRSSTRSSSGSSSSRSRGSSSGSSRSRGNN